MWIRGRRRQKLNSVKHDHEINRRRTTCFRPGVSETLTQKFCRTFSLHSSQDKVFWSKNMNRVKKLPSRYFKHLQKRNPRKTKSLLIKDRRGDDSLGVWPAELLFILFFYQGGLGKDWIGHFRLFFYQRFERANDFQDLSWFWNWAVLTCWVHMSLETLNVGPQNINEWNFVIMIMMFDGCPVGWVIG